MTDTSRHNTLKFKRTFPLMILAPTLFCGCGFFDFFKKSDSGDGSDTAGTVSIYGGSIGSRAGGVDEAALAAVHAVTTEVPPAPIRPDPDRYARRLFLQYRDEGPVVARQIGDIEAYRDLLGGASTDFSKTPQEGYDATSLLAAFKVAEIVCEGLVAPNSSSHPGWESILPADAGDWQTNLRFLAQRFLGKPSASISDDKILDVKEIMDSYHEGGNYTDASYVYPCAALSLDAEALFL